MHPVQVILIRHYKERVSKCSLQPLYGKPGYTFIKGRPDYSYNAHGHIILSVDAPELKPEDLYIEKEEADACIPYVSESVAEEMKQGRRPLILLDSTWRLLPQLQAGLQGKCLYRSIPGGVETAYPRISKLSDDPMGGLASIEALYLALRCLGDDRPEILSEYYWKDAFLEQFQGE